MTNILTFSGKKGSGKNTAANYVVGEILRTAHVIHSGFSIAPTGELLVNDIFGNTDARGVLDIANPKSYEVKQFLEREIYPFVKLYSFADLLKKEVCMKILGLSYSQCFGNDNDKNSYTELQWEDMPGIITAGKIESACGNALCDWFPDNTEEYYGQKAQEIFSTINLFPHKPGPMNAREVMQYVGSNIFRRMYGDVWVDATIRQIKNEAPELAIITDCRFPNEVTGSQNAGGRVVRLARNPYPDDQHISETALDRVVFDWGKFNIILDNTNLTIPEQNKEIDKIITSLGIVGKI